MMNLILGSEWMSIHRAKGGGDFRLDQGLIGAHWDNLWFYDEFKQLI